MAGMTKILVGGQWKTVGGPGDALSPTDRTKLDSIRDIVIVANGAATPAGLDDGTVVIELDA